jgi:flavin-dependent dehydrogenase
MNWSVVIVGAGIVGLSLARSIASEGVDVTVYDAKRHVSDNAYKASGILSTSGLESISIPYQKAVVNRLNGAVLHAGKETLWVKAADTKALVIDRGKLVEAGLKEAEKAGARVLLGKGLDKEAVRDIAKEKNTILVGADGAVSTVASAFAFPPIDEYVLTYKAEYDGAQIEDTGVVEMFFSNIAHRFFAWTVPYSKERVEAGIGVSGFAKRDSATAFRVFEKANGMLSNARFEKGCASMIPLSSRSITVKDNVALVGDAAGQVKATTGGGIIFGVSCAEILAATIESRIGNGTPLSRYEGEWRRKYAIDLRLHSMLHSYYSGINTRNFELLFKLSKLLGAESFFSKYGDMDRPSAMIRRFFLRGLTS